MLEILPLSFKITYAIIIFVLGTVFGSFLNCLAWRLVHGGSVLKGRSQCPSCGHILSPLDLFPIISWICLRGKCRYCKTSISGRYPLTELILGILFLLGLLRLDISWELLFFLVFVSCLFTLTITDLDDFVIPDGCVITTMVSYLAYALIARMPVQDVLTHILAGLVLGGSVLGLSLIMDKMLKKETMGGGDIKLLAACGLVLGPVGALFMLLAACIIGLIFAYIIKLSKNDNGPIFPFGPSIALASTVMYLFGGGLVEWYLSFF